MFWYILSSGAFFAVHSSQSQINGLNFVDGL